jgi:hypothetical protein
MGFGAEGIEEALENGIERLFPFDDCLDELLDQWKWIWG